jgi:hypothetical protein
VTGDPSEYECEYEDEYDSSLLTFDEAEEIHRKAGRWEAQNKDFGVP